MNIYITFWLYWIFFNFFINISYNWFWFINFSCYWVRRYKMSIFINFTYWIISLWYKLICLTIFFDSIWFFTFFSCIIWCIIWWFWCILFWILKFITIFIYISDNNFAFFWIFFKFVNISYILILFSYFSNCIVWWLKMSLVIYFSYCISSCWY